MPLHKKDNECFSNMSTPFYITHLAFCFTALFIFKKKIKNNRAPNWEPLILITAVT